MALKRVVVTGAAGFIGSALVRTLLENGCSVLGIDNLSAGKRSFLPTDLNFELNVGDILNKEQLARSVQQFAPEVVFHLAALHYIPYCNAHPLETIRINVEGTLSVLEACRQSNVPRLVFASTGAVYPALDGPLEEEIAPAPLDIYGQSKHFGEQLIERFQQTASTRCLIARLFNVYGPRETNLHLIPAILMQVAKGEHSIQLGNVKPKRDYVFVEDVAHALHALSAIPLLPQPAVPRVNVATGQARSVLDVLAAIEVVLGRKISHEQDPDRVRASDRPLLCGNVARLQSLTGWQPTPDMTAGLRQTLAWVRQSPPLLQHG